MKVFKVLITFLSLVVCSLGSIGIKSVEVIDRGATEEEPVDEGQRETAIIRCDISQQGQDEEWSVCRWTHDYENENNERINFYCVTTNGGGTSQCSPKGVERSYSERIRLEAGNDFCQINIERPYHLDVGDWTCHIAPATADTFIRGTTELFVSRWAEITISDPDIEADSRAYIRYQRHDDRARIVSKCRAYHGKPQPEFRWYINDVSDRNEISGNDVRRKEPREGEDHIGEYVEHTLDWTPSNFCDDYGFERDCYESDREEFEFTLICTVDQGYYYTNENYGQTAEVSVRVVNSAGWQSEINRLSFLVTLSVVVYNSLRQ